MVTGWEFVVETILRSNLQELDPSLYAHGHPCLVPDSDRHRGGGDQDGGLQVVLLAEQLMERQWDESNFQARLASHPKIAPLVSIVLGEVRGGVVGFESLFTLSATLPDNIPCPFEFKLTE